MSQGKLSRRLSAQDASFLYGEREEAPLHIGSIAVLEGDVSYNTLVQHISAKLHLIPRYTQRVVPAPFNIGHPTREWDPDFDITNHLIEMTIDSPGTDAQLIELAGTLFSPMLDRNKPLWEMFLVRGLEGNRSAVVSRVHHCLVDGVSGIELLMIVFDISPNPPMPLPPTEQPERGPIPSAASRFFDAIWDNMADGVDRWAEAQRQLVDAVAEGPDRSRRVFRAMETLGPYLRTPVDRAPFNKPLKGDKTLAVSEFSFAEVRAIRANAGGTVNDVCLTVLGGALGRYFELHGQKTEGRTARVLTPVNVRREDERGALGNRVSMLLVEVQVGGGDPIERLRAINARTDRLKRSNVAEGVQLFGDFLNSTPPALQALSGMLPSPPNTLANMICTNVPGPMIPLYCVGHRMLAHYPLIPLGWEMGVSCGVTSYDQKLYFGLMADRDCAADVERLKEFLDQAFVELRSAAGVQKADMPEVRMGQAAAAGGARRRRASATAAQALAADAG
jgi:WS/DGAT/MGAT family acyltransferase